MSNAYQFVIPRNRFLVLALCWALVAILVFAAGTMAGFLLLPRYLTYFQPKAKQPVISPANFTSEKKGSPAPQHSDCGTPTPALAAQLTSEPATSAPAAAASPVLAPKPEPASPSPSAATKSDSVAEGAIAPLSVIASQKQPTESLPATGTTKDASPAAEAPATPKHTMPPPPDPYAVSLMVQVGSFKVEENAQHLAESLRQLGYKPEIVDRTDSHNHVWHVVRLGPYREWNAASGVVMKLAANQELRPIVGPM
jgi:cell division protein FtsN